MLPLDHPLWHRLDDAHRDRDIPAMLARLAESWDSGAASSLFWDCLCHQETCYGATYAAAPYVLDMARRHAHTEARIVCACFLGFVALCAGTPDGGPWPQGLPDTPEAWEGKLGVYRTLAGHTPRSAYETSLVPRYAELVARGPVTSDDLPLIEDIRATFGALLPEYVDTALGLLPMASGPDDRVQLLSGAVAGLGYNALARLIGSGGEGMFECAGCTHSFAFLRFGDRMALYGFGGSLHGAVPGEAPMQEPYMLDAGDGTPTRQVGFMVPRADDAILSPDLQLVWDTAEAHGTDDAFFFLRHFLGAFECTHCHAPRQAMGILDRVPGRTYP